MLISYDFRLFEPNYEILPLLFLLQLSFSPNLRSTGLRKSTWMGACDSENCVVGVLVFNFKLKAKPHLRCLRLRSSIFISFTSNSSQILLLLLQLRFCSPINYCMWRSFQIRHEI